MAREKSRRLKTLGAVFTRMVFTSAVFARTVLAGSAALILIRALFSPITFGAHRPFDRLLGRRAHFFRKQGFVDAVQDAVTIGNEQHHDFEIVGAGKHVERYDL